MESRYAANDVDFSHFIERRYASTRSTHSSFDPIPLLPDDVHPATRKQIEAIVGSIDIVSARALLLRATIDHERHVGKLVSLHCETFSNTSGRLWTSGEETHKFAGDIKKSVDALDILTVERLLVDAALTFRNVAVRISAEFRRCSRQLDMALADIRYDYERCRYLLRVLSEDWRTYTEDHSPQSVRTSFSNRPPAERAAADLASSLVKLPITMRNVPRWETRRNTLLALQEIMDMLVNKLPKCEETFWGNLLTPLMLQTTQLMTNEERSRYVHEGFYYGLLRLCPFLPADQASSLYLQFPVGHALIERSQAEELAMAMRTLELRRRRPTAVAPHIFRLNGCPSRITKAPKGQRSRIGSAVQIKIE